MDLCNTCIYHIIDIIVRTSLECMYLHVMCVFMHVHMTAHAYSALVGY